MRRILIRETGFYLLLLVGFALLMHPDLLRNPGERLSLMASRENYFHPLLYAALIYAVITLLRAIVGAMGRLLKRA